MSTPGNSINESTTGITGFTGTSFTGTAATQYNVLVGGSTSSTLANVAPSATSGVPLVSQGSSANPHFGTAVVGGGGTGLTSTTAYAVLCGGTTSTGNLQSIASVGTSGQILTSNGASALPTFQNAPSSGITTIDGDSGSMTGSTVTISGGSTGLTTSASSATMDLTGTLVVGNGGTGLSSTTAYAVLCGGTTSTGALQSIASVGTSGQILTSNGAGALPTFQSAAAAAAPSMLGSYLSYNVALGSPQWIAPFGSSVQATQANVEISVPFAGTAQNLYVNLGANSIGSAVTITVNRNGSNTSIVATTTASTTGVYSDTTHTQAYSAGDTIQFQIATAGVSGAITGTICLEYIT